MTDKEKELYERVKVDPDNFLFRYLFEYDKNSNIKPIQGKILKLMPDGIPKISDQETASESTFEKKSIFYREEREILRGQIPKL